MRIIYWLLLFVSGLTYSQSDYVLVEIKEKRMNYGFTPNSIHYDSISNKSKVKLFSREPLFATLTGHWFQVDYSRFYLEDFITHCPTYVDENDNIFEIGVFDTEFHEIITGFSTNKGFVKWHTKKIIKNKGEVLNITINDEKNYILYKVKMPSKHGAKTMYTSYHLIGKKNNNIYRMMLYNIDEVNFENFERFLIETFNNN